MTERQSGDDERVPRRLTSATRRLTRPNQAVRQPVSNSELALAHLAALERLNKIITAFASMVSHETRTALVGIQGMSELIRDWDLPQDEVRGYADDIFGQAQRINELIGQMFDLNHLETGAAPFRQISVDMNRLAEEIVSDQQAKAPQLMIELELLASRPTAVGDPDRLRQAIQNVIGFVVRTAQPASRISVVTQTVGGMVHVTVHSNSLKLVDFDDWLYGRYERYEQKPSAIMGAGLGLAVARAIIELHGGSVGVVSSARNGSEFQLSLPAL